MELWSDKERSRFLHLISPRLDDQEAWIHQCLACEGDRYLIVEDVYTARAEGTISVYDVLAEKKCG